MRAFLSIGFALAVMLPLLLGCGGNSADTPDKTASKTKTEKQVVSKDPGSGIDASFLNDQQAKRLRLEETIRAFWNEKQGDPKAVRKLILNRKGEILTTKRNIRNSSLFTNAEKDSLIRPLDEESTELSRELIAFSD